MSHELNLSLPETGLAMTCRMLLAGTEAAVVSLSESPSSSGHYCNTSELPALADGTYSLQFRDSEGYLRAAGSLAWKQGQEVSPLLLSRALLVGPGSKEITLTVYHDSQPLDGVSVWASLDSQGLQVVAGSLPTDASGKVRFWLDDGQYYIWKQRSGYTFANPQPISVN